MSGLGYIEGQNVAVEYRFAGGRPERRLELATQLVALRPGVIVAPGTPAAVAAKQATGTIPIVFAGVADAVGAGLVANFARPAARIAVLYDPGDRSNVLASKELEDSAPALGFTLKPGEFKSAFAAMTRQHAQALFGLPVF